MNSKICLETEINEKELQKELKRIIDRQIQFELNNLFANKIQYCDNKQITLKSPQKLVIESKINELFNEFLNEKYIEDYIKKNFKTIIDQALEKALTHKANSIAFRNIKEFNTKLPE